MLFTFPNDWRKLRKLITWLLKAKLATEIKKLNYVQSYTLIDDGIVKKQEKLVYISTEHPDKVQIFLTKSFPEAKTISCP